MSEDYIGGVPIEAFVPNKTGTVVGKSGEQISYRNTKKRIELDQQNYYCYAFVEGGFFKLALETTHRSNNELHKSPDLFALLFARAAHEKFLERGIPIIGFKAFWIKGSDNYKSFQNGIKSGMSNIEAAKLTWSGKLAAKLGYTSNTEVYYDYPEETVEVFFT